MRIALLSDIHSNLPALNSALNVAAEMGAERYIVAGDSVLGGPFPREVVERLRGLENLDAIRGNGDRKVLKRAEKWSPKKLKKRASKRKAKKANQAWTTLQLGEDDLAWLADLSATEEISVAGTEILVVHGSPISDTDYIYPSITAAGLRSKLESHKGRDPGLLVCGHSHIPFTRPVNGTIVVNCGSVGRPSDGDPRGAFAMAEIEPGFPPRVEVVRFSYPVEETMEAMRERAVPGFHPSEYSRGVKS